MYDTDVVCTYMDADIVLESDGVTQEEEDFIRSCVYRQELLNIFHLEEFNEQAITNMITKLFEQIKDHDAFKELSTNDYSQNDDVLGFMILFSYDFLYLTHPLICELLTTGSIASTERLTSAVGRL